MNSRSVKLGSTSNAVRIAYLCSDATRRLPPQLRSNVTVYGFKEAAGLNPHSFDEIWLAAPIRMARHARREHSVESSLKAMLTRDLSYAANVVMIHPSRTQTWMWANTIACHHYLVAGCRFARNNCRVILVRSRFPMPAIASLKCEHITPNFERPSDTLTAAAAVFVMLSMKLFVSDSNCVGPPYTCASLQTGCALSPNHLVDPDAQLLPDSQESTVRVADSQESSLRSASSQESSLQGAASQDQGIYGLHNSPSNLMPSIPEDSSTNIQQSPTTAFPTDAAEKKRNRKRAAKERGE